MELAEIGSLSLDTDTRMPVSWPLQAGCQYFQTRLATSCVVAEQVSMMLHKVRKTQNLIKFSGSSLILKKGCLHKARLRYTPLVEVNQAIYAWSFRQLGEVSAKAPAQQSRLSPSTRLG